MTYKALEILRATDLQSQHLCVCDGLTNARPTDNTLYMYVCQQL